MYGGNMKNNYLNYRSVFKVLIDGIAWSFITIVAFYLRLEFTVFDYIYDILIVLAVIIPIKFLLVFINQHYKISWRYTSLQDFKVPILSTVYLTIIYFTLFIIV